jgi:hypothetical protein
MAGKVLVVMSSANHLELRDGKKYSTGFYLNEFVIPFRKLVEAGYTPVIANPKGDRPVLDPNSNNAMFFGGDDAQRADALKYVEGLDALNHPKKLSDVAKEGISGYVGVFIPGGHAPVQDLSSGRDSQSLPLGGQDHRDSLPRSSRSSKHLVRFVGISAGADRQQWQRKWLGKRLALCWLPSHRVLHLGRTIS